MKCYAFQLKSTDQLQEYIDGLCRLNNEVYWLRETLSEKVIYPLHDKKQLNQFDINGRIFSESFEFRYRVNTHDVKCIFVVNEFPDNFVNLDYKVSSMEIKEQDGERQLFVQGLKDIVRGETIFQDEERALLCMKEYQFEDGSFGYRLCGVK
ncbi:TPA: hypothetical protein ACGW3F_003163 [Bacillus paranthracis]